MKNTRRRTHLRDTYAGKPQFLDFLRRGWTVAQAARQAGIVHRTVYTWREKDDEFKAEWDDAVNEGTDMLEAEVNRRAFHGVLRPVYQQGRRVGTVREYSDQLAALILKKRNPQFKERHEHSGKGPNGEVVIIIGDREAKV